MYSKLELRVLLTWSQVLNSVEYDSKGAEENEKNMNFISLHEGKRQKASSTSNLNANSYFSFLAHDDKRSLLEGNGISTEHLILLISSPNDAVNTSST